MKVNRREVLKGGLSTLGKEAWDKVYGSDPLREENYVKVIGSPEFPKGAKLEVCLDRINKIDRIKRAAPEQENPVNPVNPVKKESVLRIMIP